MRVFKQVLVTFSIEKYEDKVLCDLLPMQASQILLGRPWQYDRKVMYDGYLNRHLFTFNNHDLKLKAMTPQQVFEEQKRMAAKRSTEEEQKAEKAFWENLVNQDRHGKYAEKKAYSRRRRSRRRGGLSNYS